MADWQWFSRAHRAVYRATSGRLGSKLVGIPMALLTTRGRKSGLERTLPLACFRLGDGGDGEEEWAVVGSNNGSDRDPAWWLNLQAEPRGRLQVGGEEFKVLASLVTPERRPQLWADLSERNPAYLRYEQQTEREIPVVILKRDR